MFLEILGFFADDAGKQIVGETAGTETERFVVEPLLSENLFDQRIVLNGFFGRADATCRLVAFLLACFLAPSLDSMAHNECSFRRCVDGNLARRSLDEICMRAQTVERQRLSKVNRFLKQL